LLQPQDRRSRRPGDEAEVARSRRRLAELGHDDALRRALIGGATRFGSAGGAWLDVGCGEGSLLAAIADAIPIVGSGIDLSAPSIALAARLAPGGQWVVANADRGLPWVDRSFDVVLSVVARLPVEELARVLVPDGHLAVVVAGDRDLAELKEIVLGEVRPSGRLDAAVERLAPRFEVVSRDQVEQHLDLDRPGLEDLMRASYLGGRRGRHERLGAIESLGVTISRDIVWCRPR
jgi:23S rRNA (guanine745-N1)-methyltransferase